MSRCRALTKNLTQERVKELLKYHPHTGQFSWRIARGNRKAGTMTSSNVDSSGYLCVRIDDVLHRQHRLVWLYNHGTFPKHQIDHIDGDRTNNRLHNLRDVTNKINSNNRKQSSKNTSGFTGVYLRPDTGKWAAQVILPSGKRKTLGSYATKFHAAAARREYYESL